MVGFRIYIYFFLKKKKKDELLRAPSVGRHNSTRVDEGGKSGNLLAIKMEGTNRSGEGWRRACYVTPDVSDGDHYTRERKKKGRR